MNIYKWHTLKTPPGSIAGAYLSIHMTNYAPSHLCDLDSIKVSEKEARILAGDEYETAIAYVNDCKHGFFERRYAC